MSAPCEKSTKRKTFTVEEKYEIIKKIENGTKQSDICLQMGLSRSTVGTVWKEKDRIAAAYERCNSGLAAKKLRKSHYEDLDQGLLRWFAQKRAEHVPVSGPALFEKAIELGGKIKHTKFVCSRSWVERFKKRHGICSGRQVGEPALVSAETAEVWLRQKWPKIRESYEEGDIFSAGETGLLFKVTPGETAAFRGGKCAGGVMSKERITILVAANFTGSEKRKLLVIGKFNSPRCFKNRTLPVKYTSNEMAWMTSEIFCQELQDWNTELGMQGRKILLLVDNCPAHAHVQELEFIKVVFMPPNTSSKLQPIDQGVIHRLKTNYRRILLDEMAASIGKGEEKFTVNVMDAVNFIHMAWQQVSQRTIADCFQHAGFSDFSSDYSLSTWTKCEPKVDVAAYRDIVSGRLDDFDFDEYVRIDENLISTEVLSDEEIVATVLVQDVEESDDEDATTNDALCDPLLTIEEAVNTFPFIRNFLQRKRAPQHILDGFAEVEMYLNESIIAGRSTM